MPNTRNPRPLESEIELRLQEIWEEAYPEAGAMPPISIEFSDLLRKTAAKVIYSLRGGQWKFVMRFSNRYFNHFGWGEEFDRVMRHEIIHVRYPYEGHGETFRAEAQRLDADRYCKSTYWDERKRTVWQCRECGYKFPSMGRETECPRCGDLIDKIGVVEYDKPKV